MKAPMLSLAFLVLFYSLAPCQVTKAVHAIGSPEDIRVRLLNGTDAERATLATTLRLVIPKWTRWKVNKDIPCKLFDSVRISYAALRLTSSQAVLQIYSNWCAYTYLVVLERQPEGPWGFVDTIPLWSKYVEPKVNFESLIENGTKEIIASGCTADSGTGISQTNLIILKLFQAGLQLIFDEPEHVHYAVPTSSRTFRGIDQSQDSDFEFIVPNVKEPATSVRQILEKQVVRDHSATITRWWRYIWVPELRVFQAIPAAEKTTN